MFGVFCFYLLGASFSYRISMLPTYEGAFQYGSQDVFFHFAYSNYFGQLWMFSTFYDHC